MRVAHVISAFELGGAKEIALDIAIGLAEKGHDCCVIAVSKPDGDDATGAHQKERLSRAGVDVVELGGSHSYFNLAVTPFRLAGFCRRWRPDIVHSHTDIPDFVVSLASRLVRFPIARTIHNVVLWDAHGVAGRFSESAFREDLVVFISAATERGYKSMRKRFRLVDSPHWAKIPNGIPFYPSNDCLGRADLVRDFGADESKTQFCFAARYTWQKGFDVLLDALEQLPDTYLDEFQLHAFGKGANRRGYTDRVMKARLPVKFHEPVREIGRLMPAFDATIVPSRYEGLALVPMHSLAAGTPVIATSAPGLTDALPPDWPLFAPIEDAPALATLISKFLDKEYDRDALRSPGLDWVRNFTIEKMVGGYEMAYTEFLDKRSSAR